jgi:hypothetical protein
VSKRQLNSRAAPRGERHDGQRIDCKMIERRRECISLSGG